MSNCDLWPHHHSIVDTSFIYSFVFLVVAYFSVRCNSFTVVKPMIARRFLHWVCNNHHILRIPVMLRNSYLLPVLFSVASAYFYFCPTDRGAVRQSFREFVSYVMSPMWIFKYLTFDPKFVSEFMFLFRFIITISSLRRCSELRWVSNQRLLSKVRNHSDSDSSVNYF